MPRGILPQLVAKRAFRASRTEPRVSLARLHLLRLLALCIVHAYLYLVIVFVFVRVFLPTQGECVPAPVARWQDVTMFGLVRGVTQNKQSTLLGYAWQESPSADNDLEMQT